MKKKRKKRRMTQETGTRTKTPTTTRATTTMISMTALIFYPVGRDTAAADKGGDMHALSTDSAQQGVEEAAHRAHTRLQLALQSHGGCIARTLRARWSVVVTGRADRPCVRLSAVALRYNVTSGLQSAL